MEKKKEEDIISRRAALEIEIFFQQRVIDELLGGKGLVTKIDLYLELRTLIYLVQTEPAKDLLVL
mgnify:CR=1 FL=1